MRKRIKIKIKSKIRIPYAQQKRTRQAYLPTAPSSGCKLRVVKA